MLTTAVQQANSVGGIQGPPSSGGSASSNSGAGGIIIGNGNSVPNIPEANEIFTDISNVEWAKEAIINLSEKGVINGVGGNRFAPDSNVTREQFVVILMRAFNIEATATKNNFDDVPADAYYVKHINTAKELGIVKGIDEKNFGVGKALTRQDLAVMVKNVCDKNGVELDTEKEVSFADGAEIAEYAKESVEAISKAGAINGFPDNTFRPKANCTRAQAAKIIYELMKGEGR